VLKAFGRRVLANIYLHCVFDLWADRWRKRHARGQVIIARYADGIVMGFEHKGEARRFVADMRLTSRNGKNRT
jgi:hypothetical protein